MTTELPPDMFAVRLSWFRRLADWWRRHRQARAQLAAQTWAACQPPSEPNLRLDLPSADADFPFRVGLIVRYHLDPRVRPLPVDPLEIAKGAISQRAREIATGFPVTAVQQFRAELELAVSAHRAAGQTGVFAWAHSSAIEVDQAHEQAVAARQDAARQAQVRAWQWEDQEHQIALLAGLITDPLRGTAWWLLNHQDQVDRLVTTADQFRQLQVMLTGTKPSERVDTVAAVVAGFCARAEPFAEGHFIRLVSGLFEQYQYHDLAERLRSVNGMVSELA